MKIDLLSLQAAWMKWYQDRTNFFANLFASREIEKKKRK